MIQCIENTNMQKDKIFTPSSIENSVDINNYPNILERYYCMRYAVDVIEKESDYCILFHSNRLCILSLAPTHPVIRYQKKISKIDFQISEHINRMNNKVSGKGKRGAQRMKKISPVCLLECEDGSHYTIVANVPGKLIEINENLVNNPQLVQTDPTGKGFIAIIFPEIEVGKTFKNSLLNPESYAELLKSRKNNNSENVS